jgi:hemerythrin-like domain-containing protein
MAQAPINNPILALSKEHRFILEQMAGVEAVLKQPDAEAMAAHLRSIESAFMPFVEKHFRFEEEVLFPAALEAMPVGPTIRVILQLTREHGEFLRWARDLFAWARSSRRFEGLEGAVRRRDIKAGIDLIRQHSHLEVTDLFPRISGNPRCCQMIEAVLARGVTGF